MLQISLPFTPLMIGRCGVSDLLSNFSQLAAWFSLLMNKINGLSFYMFIDALLRIAAGQN